VWRVAAGEAQPASCRDATKHPGPALLLIRVRKVKPQDSTGLAEDVVPQRLEVQIAAAVADKHHRPALDVASDLPLPRRIKPAEHLLGVDDEPAGERAMRLEQLRVT
jgi:hypothetical protein